MSLDSDKPTVAGGDPGPTRTHVGGAAHLRPGRVLADRFLVEKVLGVGGMGVVYQAWDRELEVAVALKVLRSEVGADDERLERFRRETLLARQVSHPNVVRIHDIYLEKGSKDGEGDGERDGGKGDLRFLTMDLIRGRSLRQILEREGPLAAERAVAYARQIAEGLEAAHARGVVHRDLKPGNILVEEPVEEPAEEPVEEREEDEREAEEGWGTARISDFGIARSVGSVGLTAPGAVVGSLSYLSPEQARGEDVDGRSDLYSLGLILHEMLTGELPHREGSQAEILAQRMSGTVSLRRLEERAPPWLCSVVGRLLARDPGRRYADAGRLRADLEAGDAGGTRPDKVLGALAAVVLAAVVLAALAIWIVVDRAGPGEGRTAPPAEEAVAAIPEARHAVAVVPFADQTGRPELAWTSRGAAEILASRLAESPSLRVVESLRAFRVIDDLEMLGGPGDAGSGGLGRGEREHLAELLDADRLITGRIRSSGDGGLGLEVWVHRPGPAAESESFRVELDRVENLERALAGLEDRLRRALEVEPAENGDEPPVVPAALAAHDVGLERLLRGEAVAAVGPLEEAVAADPGFARAWIHLSGAYQALGRTEEAIDAVRRAADALGDGAGRRALEIAAREAALRGESKEAQEILRELVERYPHDLEARVDLASSYGEAGLLADGRRILEEVVEISPRHPRAWYLLAKYSIQAGDLRPAVEEYLVRALVIQNQLGNEQGRADVLNAMGVAYHRLGELERAEERYREAAELRRRVGDTRGAAATLRNLGSIASMRGRYDEAETLYARVGELLEDLDDHHGLASLQNRLGLLAEERGRYREALELYRRSLKMRRDLGDARTLTESYNNVGYAYYLLGEYENARVYWRQALDQFAAAGNRQGAAFVRQSLGLLHLARGEWEEATASFLDALEVSRDLDLPDVTAVSHGYLGRLAQLQGRYRAALESYAEALGVLAEIDDPRGLAEFGLLRAETLLELGDAAAAEAAAAGVAGHLEGSANREQEARLRILEARLALQRGDLEAARRRITEAAEAAEASHSVVALHESRRGHALVRLAAADAEGAAEILEPLLEEVASLGHARLRLATAELLGRARLELGEAEAARRAFHAGLDALPRDALYAGRHRFHLGLARAADLAGDGAVAERERRRAQEELARIRGEVGDEYRPAFDHLQAEEVLD